MAARTYDVPALRRAIRLLELLSESPVPMGVSTISRALGINKNMVFRLLDTLCHEGWVAADGPGPTYRLTLAPYRVASPAVSRMTIVAAARGPLAELWDELGESSYLGVLHQDSVLYLDHLDSRQPVRIAGMIGGRYPLHCTAPGKALLAFAPDIRGRLGAGALARFTERTLCDPAALEVDLAAVRDRGWALDDEEYGRGIICFAVPIRDHSGGVVATIGISVTTLARTAASLVSELGPRVIATGAEVSRRMGSPDRPAPV